MVVVFLGIIAVAEVSLLVKTLVDSVLSLHFRKADQEAGKEWYKTIEMLAYRITILESELKEHKMQNFNDNAKETK